MSILLELSPIAGGLIFFIFGLQLVNRSLLELSGGYLKVGLGLLASNRITAVFVGTVLSFLLSSSGAATVVLVGMGSAGLLTLRQALAVILGAAIGTSLTVQIIAFDFGRWAIYILAGGFLARTLARYERSRQIGNAVFGLGILFFGLWLMKSGVQNIFNLECFAGTRGVIENLSANPFYLFLVGIVLTGIFQSSATTIALAFAFGIPPQGAIAVALGASIGTTAPGVVSGLRDGRLIARQIGLAHLLIKLVGASFFMAILPRFTGIATKLSMSLGASSPTHIVANANTLFNVINGGFFLLLLPLVEQAVVSLGGKRKLPNLIEGMSLGDLDRPERAVEKAHAQVVAMGRKALEMFRKSLPAFLINAHKVTDEILSGEEALDTWDTVLSDFLSRIEDSTLSSDANKVRTRLVYVVKDIEHIGDVLATELVPLARKKSRKGLDFSMEGAHHFERIHRLVGDDLAEVLDFLEGSPANPQKVLENAARIDALRRKISQAHIRRVAQGVVADVETSRIFLDAVAAVRSTHFYTCDIVQVLAASS